MVAPLALRFDAPAVFGSRDEVNAIVERMSALMPTRLADWQLNNRDLAKRKEAEESLQDAFLKVAQLAIFYRLVPSQDIHILPFGNKFTVAMGIESWKKAADRHCSLHGITYHIHTVEMPIEELKARRGKDYDPEDVGVVAYLWRSDKEGVYRIFGAEQTMSKAYGVWAKKAKWVDEKNGKPGYWQADTIPTQRSKEDVAKRRAMKAVLMVEFSLDSLLAATPAELRDNIQVLDRGIRAEERRQAIPQRNGVEIDENGFIIVEPIKQGTPLAHDVQFVVGTEDNHADIWDEETPIDAEPTEEPAGLNYLAIADRLEGACAKLVQSTKNTHANSNGPATAKQYQYLTGVIDGLTGVENSHNAVLGVLIGRAVDSGNPPGFDLCKKLLDYLVKEKTERDRHGTRVKVPNTAYRQDYADCIVKIWRVIQEAA